jgi:hypothetical protein
MTEMKLRCLVGLVAAGLLAVGGFGQAARADAINFSPNGTGTTGQILIDQWNLANSDGGGVNSNASTTPLSGAPIGTAGNAFQVNTQSLGNTFQLGGVPFALATSFTAVGNFPEIPRVVTAGTFPTVGLAFVVGPSAPGPNSTGVNAFQWNKIVPGTTSQATGVGFTNPGVTNVATGTWFTISTSSSFTGNATGTIGGSGAAFPTSTPSVLGAGSQLLGINIPNPNPAWFPDFGPGGKFFGDSLMLTYSTTVQTPFQLSVDTSGTFFAGGTGAFAPHVTSFAPSGQNGGTLSGAGDFIFQQTNPAITFTVLTTSSPTTPGIPEPSTMLLCAVGLGGLGIVRKLRRRRSA